MLMVSLLSAGCLVSGSGPGTLEVRIRDHREAIDDFDELWLTFSSVDLHPAGQPRSEGWVELQPSVPRLDLTQYVEGREAMIVTAAVEPGSYDAIRLNIDQAKGALTDGQPMEVEVRVGAVALDFQVSPGDNTVLGIDLIVLDLSDHPGQSYGLHLREATAHGAE